MRGNWHFRILTSPGFKLGSYKGMGPTRISYPHPPMRPNCVKYVELLNCISLCTLYHFVSSDVPNLWLCVIFM